MQAAAPGTPGTSILSRRDGRAQGRVPHARLHHRVTVHEIDFFDPRHPARRDKHAFAKRHAPPGKSGSAATGDDGQLVLANGTDALGDLGRVGRKNHGRRQPLGHGEAITLVNVQLVGIAQDAVLAHNGGKNTSSDTVAVILKSYRPQTKKGGRFGGCHA